MVEIEPDSKWFNRPVLEDGESFVASYPANHTQGKRAVGGKLFLTTRRLIFVPNRLDSQMGGEVWEAPIRSVLSVGRDRPRISLVEILSGAWRSRLAVAVSPATREFFVVNRLNKVVAELGGHIREGQV